MLSPLAQGKSIANLGEAGNISAAIVVAAVIRLVWGQRPGKRLVSVVLQVALVCIAAGTFLLTGPLPEVRSNRPLQPMRVHSGDMGDTTSSATSLQPGGSQTPLFFV